jgi:hypothetical protein
MSSADPTDPDDDNNPKNPQWQGLTGFYGID